MSSRQPPRRPSDQRASDQGAGNDRPSDERERGPRPPATAGVARERRAAAAFAKPHIELLTTTLWDYPSQHYKAINSHMQGDSRYAGASPSWVIWQLLMRYTRPGDIVLDPMCGSGTTLDVCADTGRTGLGFDLAPARADIKHADARKLPVSPASVDFAFIDPPYSTHIDYSDDTRCIGKLDSAGHDAGQAYYRAMADVFAQLDRALRPGRFMALYVSDSWRKPTGTGTKGSPRAGGFSPIGFELFALLRQRFEPVDIITVVRHNAKLQRGNWHKAAAEGNFFLRGFNYLFVMRKPAPASR
jgi:DNA modification methylase